MKHIKPLVILLLDLSLITGSLTLSDTVHASNRVQSYHQTTYTNYELSDFENNQLIITYKKSEKISNNILSLSTEPNVKIQKLTDTQYLVTTSTKKVLQDKLYEYQTDPYVEAIQPNFTYKIASATEEPYYDKQWWATNHGTFATNGYKVVDPNKYISPDLITMSKAGIDINISPVWSLYTGTRPVTVALLDTGVDITHEELADVIFTNTAEIPADGIDNDGNGFIDDVHGWNFCSNSNNVSDYIKKKSENNHATHCAGIIAASVNGKGISGIANNTNVKILPVKVLDENGTGSTANIIKGIKYAEKMGAQICNLSLSFENSLITNSNDNVLKKVILGSNMMFVVASGNGDSHNEGIDLDKYPRFPAAFDCDNIISVANLATDGSLDSSSNYGAITVDIAAPGKCILSSLVDNSYGYCSGTSMSAPMVTGGLVQIYSYYPNINIRQAARILLSTTKSLDSLTGKVSTGGMLDIYGSLTKDINTILPDLEPPIMKFKIINQKNSYQKNLTITIDDDNLKKVYYTTEKNWTAADFYHGYKGTELCITNNTITIPDISETTTYTFFAIDSYDNESTLEVAVTINPTKKITLSAKKKILKIGKTYHLIASLDHPSSITYTSSNKLIARVSKDGHITPKKKGSCKIIVRSINGITATCKITVK